MKWGIWHKNVPSGSRPMSTCEADSHEEAEKKLLVGCPVVASETKVEPVNEPGRSHVGRFYSQSGPVLSEKDLGG